MKKTFTTALAITLTVFFAQVYATNHVVTAVNYAFSPLTFNCTVGDTVTWEFVSGIEHEPHSDTIPNGAAPWDFVISPNSTTASYVVTTAGTYNYKCALHFSDGMFANFVASPSVSTGVQNVAEDMPIRVYPLPFQRNLTIDMSQNGGFKNNVTIEVFNGIGQRKFEMNQTSALSAPVTLDLSELAAGVYFLTIGDGTSKKTYRLIKSE